MLVVFSEEQDQPTCIVPVKRIKGCGVKDLTVEMECQVEWSDKKTYPARVLAVGK